MPQNLPASGGVAWCELDISRRRYIRTDHWTGVGYQIMKLHGSPIYWIDSILGKDRIVEFHWERPIDPTPNVRPDSREDLSSWR